MFISSDDGVRIHVVVDGPTGAPALLMAHSVGCDLTLWDAQAAALRDTYRVIRFDARGHGRSDAPAGDYTIDQLGGDALCILDALQIDRAHLCGLSLGGTLGLWMALHARDRLRSLTLADTAARLGTIEGWQARIDATRVDGTASIASFSMTRFFSDRFRQEAPETVKRFERILSHTQDAGFAGCCAVLRDCDFSDDLALIDLPTLILCGNADVPTPPADSEILAHDIAGASLRLLESGHISAVEAPEAFTAALEEHLRRAAA